MAQRLPSNEQVAFQQPTGGAPPNLGSVPTDDIIKAGAAIGQQVGAIIDGAVELEDFAYQQAAEIQLRNTQIQANLDVQERLQLPDGHERAFFDAKGNYKPVVMQNIIHQHGKSIASLSGLPMSAGRRLALAGKVAQVGLGMIESFTLAGLDTQRKRALGNFETNYRLALETGDYGGAEQAAYDGVKAGLYSEAQGKLLAFQARKKGAVDELDAMVIESPRAAVARLNSGEFDQYTTPAERARIRKAASQTYERAARQGEADAMVLSGKDLEPLLDDPETERIRKLMATNPVDSLPRSTAFENAHWQRLVQNPADQESRRALLAMATLEARSQQPGAGNEAQRDEFVQRYTRFGVFDEGDIERIWKDGQKYVQEATSVSIDANAHLKAFFASGDWVDAHAYERFLSDLNQEGAAAAPEKENAIGWGEDKPAGKYYDKYAAAVRREQRLGIDAKVSEADIKSHALAAWVEEHEAQKKAEIISAYNAWRSTEEGRKASPLAQRTRLDAICERVLGRPDGVELGSVDEEEAAYKQALKNQGAQAKFFKEQVQDARVKAFSFPSSSMPIVPFKEGVAVGFAASGDSLNLNEIRLPAAMMEGVTPGKTSMLICLPGSGKAMRVTVVGQCEGNEPQFSDELGVYLQVAPGEKRAFDMRMLSPAAAKHLDAIQTDRQRGLAPQTSINVADSTLDLGGLSGYKEVFEAAGKQYGIDPNLLMAISLHETGRGTSRAFREGNNAMGISDANGVRKQRSVADSIHYMAGLLAESPLYKKWRESGRSLAVLQSIYAPVGAGNDPRGLNKHWQDGVRKYYKQLTGKDYS